MKNSKSKFAAATVRRRASSLLQLKWLFDNAKSPIGKSDLGSPLFVFWIASCLFLLLTEVAAAGFSDVSPNSVRQLLVDTIGQIKNTDAARIFKGDANVEQQTCDPPKYIGKSPVDNGDIFFLECSTGIFGMGITAQGFTHPPMTGAVEMGPYAATETWQVIAALFTVMWAYDPTTLHNADLFKKLLQTILDSFPVNGPVKEQTIQAQDATYSTVKGVDKFPWLIVIKFGAFARQPPAQ
jgi:hypothetical protein